MLYSHSAPAANACTVVPTNHPEARNVTVQTPLHSGAPDRSVILTTAVISTARCMAGACLGQFTLDRRRNVTLYIVREFVSPLDGRHHPPETCQQ